MSLKELARVQVVRCTKWEMNMSFGALLEPRLSANSSLGCSPGPSVLRCLLAEVVLYFIFVIGANGVGSWRGLLVSRTIFFLNEMTRNSPALVEKKKRCAQGNIVLVLPLFLKESLTRVQYIFKQMILLFSSLLQYCN